MVAGIGDPQHTVSNHQALRSDKLFVFASRPAPLCHEMTVRVEFLDPIGIAIFTDVIAPVLIGNGIGDEREFSWVASRSTTNFLCFDAFAVKREHQHAVVMRIGDKQQIVLGTRSSFNR